MLWLHLKTLLRLLLLPPISPLLLAIAGLWLQRRRPRLGRGLLIAAVASLWLLATPVVADALTQLAQRYPALRLDQIDGAQAIVILGGGAHRDYSPEYQAPAASFELLDRLAYGAFLARRTNLPILISGFGVEASAMRASLRQNFDLDPRWVDDRAYDTFENARNAARLLLPAGVHRIVLVTSATHMWRAAHECMAAGFEVLPAPIGLLGPQPRALWDFLPSAQGLLRSYLAIYELIGEPVRLALAALHLRRQ